VSKGRILVVEDEPTIRANLVRLLTLEGFEVGAAENGLQGLALARTFRPAVVISDVGMPELDGYGMLEQLRADPSTASIPLIFLSARAERADMRRGMSLGADDYVTKPVSREELLEALTARIRRSADHERQASRSLSSGWMDLRQDLSAPAENSTCQVSVLFADVRNFTTFSERLEAAEVADMLNAYYHEACEPLIEHGGRIVRFLGDGVMAVFMGNEGSDGAPRSARRALRAALRMVLAAKEFGESVQKRFAGRGLPQFAIGVGVHTGEVALTRLGSRQQAELTVIGDTVNIAARLEARTKDMGWSVIASEVTVQLAGSTVRTGARAVVPLKGRSAPVQAIEVLGLAEDDDETLIIAPHVAEKIRAALESNAQAAARALTLHRAKTLDMDAVAATTHVSIRGYRLLRRIGSGGMCEVFLAARDSDGAELVLKVLGTRLEREPELLNRFIKEYALLTQIEHPNVVRIYDQGFTDEHAFIAMEYFSEGDIRSRMGGPLAPEDALSIGLQLARALVQIHAQGIIHRDLKPENLMLRKDGSIALADFGIAKHLGDDLAQTRHGQIVGTPFYMSPEQAGGRTVTTQSDLYSLGVILYELFMGARPFDAENLEMLMSHHLFTPAPPLPPALAEYRELVARLMEKEPSKRFASAADVVSYIGERWPQAGA